MIKKILVLSGFVLAINSYQAQTAPVIEWQKSFGGSKEDFAYDIKQTADGGYIVAGDTNSTNGDVVGNHGSNDGWVVKLNTSGIVEWQKTLGGSSYDTISSILQDTDGNYVASGYSYSPAGGRDYWVVKLNQSGNIIWEKLFGGSSVDTANSICQSTDGGYIIGGYTNSNDGFVAGNHGGTDFWIVKLDTSGNLVWQKTLGGSDTDVAFSISATTDGGCVAAGRSMSNDGDVTGNHGSYQGGDRSDYWVVKLDPLGNLQWQKSLGGTGQDIATSVKQIAEGGYIVVGYTWSGNDGDVTQNKGNTDYWVVKLNPSGNIEWQKSLGGTLEDHAYSVWQTTDGGYVVAGETYSPNTGDVTDNHGSFDAWLVKLNPTGNILWKKSYGGIDADMPNAVQQTADGGFVFAAISDSKDGDATGSGNHGSYDYWVVKLAPEEVLAVEDTDSRNISFYPNPVINTLNLQSKEKIQDVTIYNIDGKLLNSVNINSTNAKIDMSAYTPGTYIIQTNGGKRQTKIIKK
ncbi:T9SS type A sorting domain-containing protein [Epilithonimonas xixisoli]|uniref:Putative secreted protein (Por secretion system target) n=1 Tax=Epilithonimonas xixisoli TaxID=1476462 RepID=A0A4R8I2U6_9FLAO|nr:T9SS type A sorting domain-containing protein [Epilithonimonas xixisoli]TDX82558.1 putative secreted protein (Por secretion system target) [Epilithonimonas xixisoli]